MGPPKSLGLPLLVTSGGHTGDPLKLAHLRAPTLEWRLVVAIEALQLAQVSSIHPTRMLSCLECMHLDGIKTRATTI